MSKVDLVIRDHTQRNRPALSRAVALRMVSQTLRRARHTFGTRTIEIAVVFVGTARMRALNKRWRGKDKPTDVLAFPLHQPDTKGYTAVSLGDVFICPVIVRRKAALTGLPVRTQMAWTLVHGVLHLCGFDHERGSAAAERMAQLERDILKNVLANK